MVKGNLKIVVLVLFVLSLSTFLYVNDFFSARSIFYNKYEDKKLLHILKLQLARDTQSLEELYFISEKEVHQKAIVEALGKIQAESSLPFFEQIIADENAPIGNRQLCAFAIGQYRDPACAPLLEDLIKENTQTDFVESLIVALGKVGTKEQLALILTLKEEKYEYAFACLQGLFELLGKGIYSEQAVFNVLEKFLSEGDMYRVLGAQYLSRVPNLDAIIPYASITGLINNEMNADSRSKLVLALRHYPKNEEVKKFLLTHLSTEQSPLVLMEALQTLPSFTLTYTEKKKVIPFFSHPNKGVVYYASKLIADQMLSWEVEHWEGAVDQITYPKAKAILLASMVKHEKNKVALEKTKALYNASTKTFERAWYLNALCMDTTQWELATEIILKDTSAQLRTSALQSLVDAYKKSDEQQIKKVYPQIEEEFLTMLKQMLVSNDEGLIAIAAASLRDPVLGYKRMISDNQFLYKAKAKLELPLQYEALYELNKTIAYFEGKEEIEMQPDPYLKSKMSLRVLAGIQPEGMVRVETSKGSFYLQLNLDESPIAVQHFVENMEQGYFNQKRFHRVVYDFVVQTGCHRGDGFGTDATVLIPSEFNNDYYVKGTVGMASLGKDTESSQWFISLTDTPRLNGRYTVIGQVIEGMEVVESLSEEDFVFFVAWDNSHLLM